MKFQQSVTVTEIGEQRTSARGNSYVPVTLEYGNGETFRVAAMGDTAGSIQSAGVGGTVNATFDVRQFGKEVSLQLKSAEVENGAFD